MKKNKVVIAFVLLLSFFLYVLPVAAEDRQIEDEIIYDILVDRYNNGDHSIDEQVDINNPQAYQGGDLVGITKRLHEKVDLGVTTLLLSPIMANSPDGYHGYWIEDFTAIDEQFGTFADLEELVEKAHEQDVKIVLEFVTNYISKDHPIAIDPNRADWILTEDVAGPAWADGVVQLDQTNPEVQQFLIEAATFWLEETDIDGLALHAVDQSDVDFINTLTTELKNEFPDAYLLGDVLDREADIANIMANTALDAIDNYPVSEAIANLFSLPDQAAEEIVNVHQQYGDFQSLLRVDDEYSKRFTQLFSENGRNTVTVWQLALTYMYTTPGTPVLLQGSEVGMYGDGPESSQRLVPFASGEAELKEFHNRISSLRHEFPILRSGDFELVGSEDSFTVFTRRQGDQVLYVAINNGSESSYMDITDVPSDKMLRGYLGDNIARENEEGNHRIGIPRESIEVYEVVDLEGFNWIFISLVAFIMIIFIGGVLTLQRKQKQRERVDTI